MKVKSRSLRIAEPLLSRDPANPAPPASPGARLRAAPPGQRAQGSKEWPTGPPSREGGKRQSLMAGNGVDDTLYHPSVIVWLRRARGQPAPKP